MMKFLRSQSQTVLVVVLGFIALGFLFYGNSGNLLTNGAGRTTNDFGRINGEDLSLADLSDAIRNTRDAIAMGDQAGILRQPGAPAYIAEEAWRRLLLQAEADRLHINISDQEVIDSVHNSPLFKDKNGAYSPEMYDTRMKMFAIILHVSPDAGVDPVANTKAIFEKVMRDDLRVQAVKEALFSGVHAPAHDIAAQYEKRYAPVTLSIVTLDPKAFVAKAQVSPAEIEAEYKAHPTDPAYRTKEKRKVDYVLFMLSPEDSKLPDAQKAAAKDALGQKALEFALAFQPNPTASTENAPAQPVPDFMVEAKKRSLSPGTTNFFTDEVTPAGVPPSSAFNTAAFTLTKDNSISKIVELDNGVAILHLVEIQPSDLRPLDEVKGDITKKLQASGGQQTANITANIEAKLLQETVKKGTDFKTAAEGMKLKVDTIPAFVPIKTAQSDVRQMTFAYESTLLEPGQVSDPIPMQGDNSIAILHLDSRGKADPAGLADFEKQYRQSQDVQFRDVVYEDWASWKSSQPGTRKPKQLDDYGAAVQ